MDLNLSELLAALPEDESGTPASTGDEARAQLTAILADLALRPTPTASLHRLWTLSELSAQIALAYFAWWVRQWFADAETRDRRLMETNLRVALKMFHRLGYLRGAMTKLGQTAGNLPRILPDEVAATLDRLHFNAPPMHYSLIREVVRNEFGAEPETVFAAFDREAFAAASLGQVHRATLKSGQEVAVKIQYPGIARTIDADFRNLAALLFPLRLGKDWDGQKAHFEEIRRMLNQEVDYQQEAESLRRARALFRPEDGIVAPQVYAEHSTRRVLTTEYIRGLHLDAFLAGNPPQRLRNEFGTKMYVAWYRLYLAYMSYGDPHSGNYLFLDDGRLGLIDFGCVQNFDAEQRELVRLSDGLAQATPAEFRDFVKRAIGLADNDPDLDVYLHFATESTNWMLETIRHDGPFDFGDGGHFERGFEWFSRLVRQRRMRGNPMYVYWNRSVFGLMAILYRLRAQVDVNAVIRQEREIWHQRTP